MLHTSTDEQPHDMQGSAPCFVAGSFSHMTINAPLGCENPACNRPGRWLAATKSMLCRCPRHAGNSASYRPRRRSTLESETGGSNTHSAQSLDTAISETDSRADDLRARFSATLALLLNSSKRAGGDVIVIKQPPLPAFLRATAARAPAKVHIPSAAMRNRLTSPKGALPAEASQQVVWPAGPVSCATTYAPVKPRTSVALRPMSEAG